MYLFRIFNFSRLILDFWIELWKKIILIVIFYSISIQKLKNQLREIKFLKQIHENTLPFFIIAILFSASLCLCCSVVSTFISSSSAHILPLPFFHALLFQHISPPLLPITQIYCNTSRLWDLCRTKLLFTITFHIQKSQVLHRFLQLQCNAPLEILDAVVVTSLTTQYLVVSMRLTTHYFHQWKWPAHTELISQ